MINKKLLYLCGMILVAGLLLMHQPSQAESTTSGIPTTAKTTKKPNVIKLGKFDRPGGLVTQLYQITPRQSRALKLFLSKWVTAKGNVAEYEELRLLEVTDVPENMKQIDDLLGAIDQPEPQILLQARIAEITIDKELQVGVDYGSTSASSAKGRSVAGLGEFPPTNVDNTGSMTFNPEDYLAAVAGGSTFQGASAVFFAKGKNSRLDLALRAMEKSGKAKIISSPRILTINGQEAVILTGQEFPYVSSLTYVGGVGQASTSYKEVGVKLSVIPYFIGNNTIELVITPEVSVVTGWKEVQAGVSLPILAKRSTATKVNIKNGETLAIGGLLKEENLTLDKGVPLLKNIPLLGFLFKYHKNTKVNTDLVFFITPRLITNAEDTLAPIEEKVPEDLKK